MTYLNRVRRLSKAQSQGRERRVERETSIVEEVCTIQVGVRVRREVAVAALERIIQDHISKRVEYSQRHG